MASTNKTEHYGLPQYVPSDHPDFLTDFNNAFKKIDDVLYQLASSASTVETQTNQNSSSIVTINQSIADLTTRVQALENVSVNNE